MDHFEKRRRDYQSLIKPDEIKALTNRPLVNENSTLSAIWSNAGGGLPQTSNSSVDYKTLWNTYLSSPEAIAPCDTIVTDIISDGYKIRPVKENDTAAVRRATEFLEANCFKTHVLPSQLLDQLVTGDSYIYAMRVKPDKFREAVKAIAKRLPLNNNPKTREYLYYSLIDEDIFRTKSLINIASSTVKIFHDIHGNVEKYQQKVGLNTAEFTPKEVMHFKYRNVNGKVYGFCPLKAILGELSMLASIKDSAGNIFENGGIPMNMFNLEVEVPNSPNVKFLQEQLKELKNNMREHKNLITTGKVEVQQLENITATMQYRELMEQMTRIVYTVWGVPPAKMGQTSGEKGAYDSGLATESYYRRIAHMQDSLYSIYNTQLMIPEFGVQLIPNKAYLQDEMKETQVLKQKFDIAQQGWDNNWVKKEWIVDYLNIDPRYIGSFEKEEPLESIYRQGDIKNKTLNETTAQQETNKMRSETQKAKKPEIKALTEKGFTPREAETILFNEKLENGDVKDV